VHLKILFQTLDGSGIVINPNNYDVIMRSENNYVLKIKGKKVNVTIDRLKLCFEIDPGVVQTSPL